MIGNRDELTANKSITQARTRHQRRQRSRAQRSTAAPSRTHAHAHTDAHMDTRAQTSYAHTSQSHHKHHTRHSGRYFLLFLQQSFSDTSFFVAEHHSVQRRPDGEEQVASPPSGPRPIFGSCVCVVYACARARACASVRVCARARVRSDGGVVPGGCAKSCVDSTGSASSSSPRPSACATRWRAPGLWFYLERLKRRSAFPFIAGCNGS